MNFIEAYKESTRTGKPIKRKTQSMFGIIVNNLLQNGQKTIAKYVSRGNVYNLDLEDITADDWEIEGRE